jgi:hypothetical protein
VTPLPGWRSARLPRPTRASTWIRLGREGPAEGGCPYRSVEYGVRIPAQARLRRGGGQSSRMSRSPARPTTPHACRWRVRSAHIRPGSRWNASASGRPESGVSREHHLELQPLQFVRRLRHDPTKPRAPMAARRWSFWSSCGILTATCDGVIQVGTGFRSPRAPAPSCYIPTTGGRHPRTAGRGRCRRGVRAGGGRPRGGGASPPPARPASPPVPAWPRAPPAPGGSTPARSGPRP